MRNTKFLSFPVQMLETGFKMMPVTVWGRIGSSLVASMVGWVFDMGRSTSTSQDKLFTENATSKYNQTPYNNHDYIYSLGKFAWDSMALCVAAVGGQPYAGLQCHDGCRLEC